LQPEQLNIICNNLKFYSQEVHRRFPDGIPLLDPVEDMNIKDERLKSIVQKIEAFELRMYKHPLHNSKNLKTVYEQCEKKSKVENIPNLDL